MEDFFKIKVINDLSIEQKKTFESFCKKAFKLNFIFITYGDMYYYACDKHMTLSAASDKNHSEIMKIMWFIFMKKDSLHARVFYNLIPIDEIRVILENLYTQIQKNEQLKN